ncbi:Phospholipase D zeta 2 [Phytophthora citrophthora]|uniref:Phospholipase n=1 Tax=Phytophthora citrophthora TaxID=4793 RepID=A0AAD9H1F6_9STRA|nr:Phospholipase D zeta 2 [Phytophthora citrophthora]
MSQQTTSASPGVADVVTAAQQQQEPATHTASSVFDTTTGMGGPGSTAGGRPRLEHADSTDYFGFLHHNTDEDIYVFDEPPEVRVLGGRFEDSWPTRYVEYDVELKYKSFKWKVEIPKSSISSLWFYIKSRPHLRHAPSGVAAEERAERGIGESGVPEHTPVSESRWPQLRKLFLTSADKSVGTDMVALVQQLLETVVKVPRLLRSPYVAAMFQVSNSTFDDEMGRTSVREGWLKTRFWLKGNRENVRINRASASCDNECFNCMCVVKRVNFRAKRLRWVSLKTSSIAIFDSIEDTIARKAFLFDSKFNIERGLATTGSSTTMLVSNATYVLQMEAKSKQALTKWANDIRRIAEASNWSQAHRDGSFAIPRNPVHMTSFAQWYVDGSGAYEAIYHAIQSARKEIFIAGWWVCPTIHLLRPAEHYPESRLDVALQKKAEEGVQVYVLMYKEVSMALTLNSMFSKQVLSKLHKNVHVLRDPDFLMKQLGLWSHHEKIVSIDQRVSFVGGLDLCFGRWDTHSHELFDEPGKPTDFVGKDFSNPRVKDFIEVDRPEEDMIDRNEVPRMPWHDCHCRLEGQPARDVARHFVQRWNYSVSTRKKSRKLHHLVPMKDYPVTIIDKHGPQKLTKRLQKAVHAVRAMRGLSRARANTENRGFNSDRRMARMLSSQNESGAVPILQEGESGDVMLDLPGEDEDNEELFEKHKQEVAARGYRVNTQILRSLSLWSGGVATERSIQNAYIRLIGSAQHFVYIENQFFVSGLEGDHGCSNRIANALVERIRRASDNNEKFRVIVIMPLLPAFPGKPDDKDASSLRGVMHWQYRTICRGEHSIYQRLYQELEDDDPFKYIAFYGLRNHSAREGAQAQTEEIYIHSKVMIVDDRACIIGSANINERSMCGDRDSEIAVLVEDHEMEEEITLADGAYNVGKFAHSFRMKLFEEHFGVKPGTPMYNKYQDPVSKDAWFSMQEQAMNNHQIYDSVFGCLPSDSVTSFAQIDSHIQSAQGLDTSGRGADEAVAAAMGSGITDATSNNGEEARMSSMSDRVLSPTNSARGTSTRGRKSAFSGAMNVNMKESSHIAQKKHELGNIQGHIVYFPLKFLVDEQLEPKLFPADLFQ